MLELERELERVMRLARFTAQAADRLRVRLIIERAERVAERAGSPLPDGSKYALGIPLEREQSAVEPPCGYPEGFQRLMEGRCSYCGQRMQNVGFADPAATLEQRGGLTWSCIDGCNP